MQSFDCRDKVGKNLIRRQEKMSSNNVRCRNAEAKVREAEAKVREAEAKVREAEARAREALGRERHTFILLQNLNEHHALTISSYSWRITRPLRWISLQLSLLKKPIFFPRLRLIGGGFILLIYQRISSFVHSVPLFHRLAIVVKSLLKKYVLSSFPGSISFYKGMVSKPCNLSIRELPLGAQNIYAELDQIITKYSNKSDRCE